MAAASVARCGDWLMISAGKTLLSLDTGSSRNAFVFDCSAAERRPRDEAADGDDHRDAEVSRDEGTDCILALAVSPTGKLVALTDDNKRLVLFRTEPKWQCVSTRWVVRRCTSLAFSMDEECVLVADKSGDVYSFSTKQPHAAGQVKLGHLSMLLALTVTPDNKFSITADRDEKIRVSCLRGPHNIQSFCLGHTEFVSALLVPSKSPDCLLSGSGDGTVKLWHYETGRRLQSWDLQELSETPTEERLAVRRISCSPDGHVAVQCDRCPWLQLFEIKEGSEVKPSTCLRLPHVVWDMVFDQKCQLWILLENQQTPVLLYKHAQQGWEQCDLQQSDLKRVSAALHTHWDCFKGRRKRRGCSKREQLEMVLHPTRPGRGLSWDQNTPTNQCFNLLFF
ncbi:tRNA (guanine-N(7)-)-methyltransferase non-catalytic subunit wdr4 isoform X2 [Denticeps clupeoides]|uniref:tRNA (guanine-N(7)-)-methyltransferase non-catalytic subunit wdr4 isoform X2 n=1 Tax=Denticeps clupeoides TaxID=299321 RepID=UPI0010A3C642|nr:tRNA (guanine-N(7)-)-methyltransferase non-catalytic subunit WDR4 isoform X2 [Denticeps clupeoides]